VIVSRYENEILFEKMFSIDKNTQTASSVILFKDNDYWIFHKNVIEDLCDEKNHPADKLWLVVKFINNSYDISQRGYKIKIGDTLKFGRVRFKIIEMHNEVEGNQVAQRVKYVPPK